jgi:hypothetical protein
MCRGCRKPFLWATDETTGEPVALTWEPDPNGDTLVDLDPKNPRRLLGRRVADRRLRASMRAAGWGFRSWHGTQCVETERRARGPKALRMQPTGFAPRPVDTADEPTQEGLF